MQGEIMGQRRNLAFYKKSGEPWANEEFRNIQKYCGDPDESNSIIIDDLDSHKEKFIFDDGTNYAFMYAWALEGDYATDLTAFNNCAQVAYEDIFFSGEEYEDL